MRVLHDSPTMAVGASSPALLPLLTPEDAAQLFERDLVARIPSSFLIAALVALAYILCAILGSVLDGSCAEDAPAPPPHAAAAAACTASARARAAGGVPATDAWLKKRGLRKIPVVAYEAKPGASATDVCVICLGEFDDGDKVCVLPRCHHGFHVQCIDPWLAKRPSCPTCRDSLRS